MIDDNIIKRSICISATTFRTYLTSEKQVEMFKQFVPLDKENI